MDGELQLPGASQFLHAFIDGVVLYNNGRLAASGSGYFLGGPLNGLASALKKIVKAPSSASLEEDSKAEIIQAFKARYYATRNAQNWNRVCYRAERRLQMLMELKTRMK
jgi:hypothetical protein